MKSTRNPIYLCLIPLICVLPMFGTMACTVDEAAMAAEVGSESFGNQIAELHETWNDASPYLQEDLERLWHRIAGEVEIYAEELGIAEPMHPLEDAREARERLIAGESFNDVVRAAMSGLTHDDLEQMPASDLNVLNRVLPFDIDLTQCGESLADVLNALDIGQVSAILQSEQGFHIIQLIDREGGRLKIGHIVFEINPAIQTAETEEAVDEEASGNPIDEAIARLTRAIHGQ